MVCLTKWASLTLQIVIINALSLGWISKNAIISGDFKKLQRIFPRASRSALSTITPSSTTKTSTTAASGPTGNPIAPVPVAPAATPQTYLTSKDGSSLLALGGGGNTINKGYFQGDSSGVTVWNVSINDVNNFQQQMTGFGAAITDTVVNNYNALTAGQQAGFMNDFFGASGLNLNLLRHTIGSSDLTPPGSDYTFDDSTTSDTNLSNFGLTKLGTAMLNLIATIKQSKSSVLVLGASWSAPAWMKVNKLQSSTDSATNILDTNNAQYYASYFIKYLQA